MNIFQVGCVLFAFFTCLTRVSDYKHHPEVATAIIISTPQKAKIICRMSLAGRCLEVVLPFLLGASCWRARPVRWPAPPPPPPSWPSPPPASTAGRTSVFPDRRRRMTATSAIFEASNSKFVWFVRFSLGFKQSVIKIQLQPMILVHNAGSF